MTTKELLYLSWMVYLDLPSLYSSLIGRGGGVPVAAFADAALRMDAAGILKCVRLNEPAKAAARMLTESDWVIRDYINMNASDGFVAYVVDTPDALVIAMRGSESPGECVATYVDWVDNVCEPFSGSVQLDEIRKLTRRYAEGRVIFTGHSKGGHNALAALAASDNPDARTVAFNGQGFGDSSLTEVQLEKLAGRGLNYVVADDIVGALLNHPERRVYVQKVPGTNAHMPEAFAFDDAGEPVRAPRSLKSYAIEVGSRIAEHNISGGRDVVARICRYALNAYDML